MTHIRVGVVGLGLIAQVAHLPHLAHLSSGFRVTHLSDLSEPLMRSIAATLPGPPAMSQDAVALFADPEVDAVLLLTPGAHGPLAALALQAGKHVLAEKPLCITQREARELAQLAAERELVLQVAYMKAYDPAMSAARAALEQIGELRLVSVEVRHPDHQRQLGHLDVLKANDVDMAVVHAAEAAERELAAEALGGAPAGIAKIYRSFLLGSVIHELSALRALGFEPPARWDHVKAWPFDPHRAEQAPPSLAATAELVGGALLRLQWLWVDEYPRYEETISVVGTAGAIGLDMPQPYGPDVSAALTVRASDGRYVEIDDGRHRRRSGFIEELHAFHAAIVVGGQPTTGADAALADTASLQAFSVALAANYGSFLAGETSGLDGRGT